MLDGLNTHEFISVITANPDRYPTWKIPKGHPIAPLGGFVAFDVESCCPEEQPGLYVVQKDNQAELATLDTTPAHGQVLGKVVFEGKNHYTPPRSPSTPYLECPIMTNATATATPVLTVQEHLAEIATKIDALNAIVETVHDAMKHLNQYETNCYAKVLRGAVDEFYDLKLHAEYLQGNLEGVATAPKFDKQAYQD